MTNLNLTDMETCYKMWKSDIIKSVRLKENRFGFEPEGEGHLLYSQIQPLVKIITNIGLLEKLQISLILPLIFLRISGYDF